MNLDTINIALLAIRVTLGTMLMTHGINKIFGVGGISGTARWFEGLGLRPGHLHAWVAATTEVGAGALMGLGLFFPAPCAAFVGLMTVAGLTDHRGKGFFVFKGGWEYVAVVGVIAGALALTGPGRWSADRLLDLQLDGFGWGLGAVALGLAAGGGTIVIFRKASPAEMSA